MSVAAKTWRLGLIVWALGFAYFAFFRFLIAQLGTVADWVLALLVWFTACFVRRDWFPKKLVSSIGGFFVICGVLEAVIIGDANARYYPYAPPVWVNDI